MSQINTRTDLPDVIRRIAEDNDLGVCWTGGGCRALGKAAPDNTEVSITDIDGTACPVDPTEPVFIGWNDATTGDCLIQAELPNLLDAIKALAYGPWTIPSDLWGRDTVLWTADEFWNAERYPTTGGSN